MNSALKALSISLCLKTSYLFYVGIKKKQNNFKVYLLHIASILFRFMLTITTRKIMPNLAVTIYKKTKKEIYQTENSNPFKSLTLKICLS